MNNLNSFHTAPLDYALWQTLDRQSPIASRLYEFLLLSFHSGTPTLRINYPYLARLLPIHPERYPSLAHRQMWPALDLLTQHGLVGTVAWVEGRSGQLQLLFRAGRRLSAKDRPAAFPPPPPLGPSVEEPEDTVQVQELRSSHSPGWFLVRKFNRLWMDAEFALSAGAGHLLCRSARATRCRAGRPMPQRSAIPPRPKAGCSCAGKHAGSRPDDMFGECDEPSPVFASPSRWVVIFHRTLYVTCSERPDCMTRRQ